eukprot:8453711-Pyramimonas_sp.AAC.1
MRRVAFTPDRESSDTVTCRREGGGNNVSRYEEGRVHARPEELRYRHLCTYTFVWLRWLATPGNIPSYGSM